MNASLLKGFPRVNAASGGLDETGDSSLPEVGCTHGARTALRGRVWCGVCHSRGVGDGGTEELGRESPSSTSGVLGEGCGGAVD